MNDMVKREEEDNMVVDEPNGLLFREARKQRRDMRMVGCGCVLFVFAALMISAVLTVVWFFR